MKHILLIGLMLLSACIGIQAQEKLTLSHKECRELALLHSEDLQSADNAIKQADIDKSVAFKAYLPKVDGTLSGTYMTPDMDMMGMALQMRGMYMAGISVTQPIYAGGKIRAANKLAKIGQDCSKESQRKVRMQVLADADNAYWSFISVHWKEKMLRAYKRQMDTLYQQVEKSLSVGMSIESELLRIDSKRRDIEYQLQKASNGLNLCRLSLCNVIGCSFDTQIEPTDTIIATSAVMQLDDDISMRPELKLLEKQIESAKQQVTLTRADFLPQIGLSLGYMYYGNVKLKGTTADAQGNYVSYTQKFNDGFGILMASVSIPIFHWGEGIKKVKKAKLEVENAQLALQKNTRLMNIEVQQAIQNVMDSQKLVETATIGRQQADENLRVMNDRYENGMCTLIDLLDAQSQWHQAQSNLIEAQTQQKMNETEYLRVTGRL